MTKGTAVITGSANGIGQAYAQRLATEGFDIAAIDVADASATRTLVEAQGRAFYSSIIDVTSEKDTLRAAREIEAQLPPVSCLVNNAGIYPQASFDDMDFATWRKVLAINLDGVFLMTKAFLPMMRAEKYGRIINVASSTFWLNLPDITAYVASKGGVIGLSRSLACELGRDGITVNVVAPGLIDTANGRDVNGDESYAHVPKLQAISKILTPDDLVGIVSFLCSKESGMITGQTIAVDGGQIRH